MTLNRVVARLYLAVLLLFLLNKFVVRPWVLDQEFPAIVQIAVFSAPNFFEAVVGMTNTVALLSIAKHYFAPRFDNIPQAVISLLALLIAGTYVLTQEVKLHNLGGNNVYDPFDVVASIIGLLLMFVIYSRLAVIDIQQGSNRREAAQLD